MVPFLLLLLSIFTLLIFALALQLPPLLITNPVAYINTNLNSTVFKTVPLYSHFLPHSFVLLSENYINIQNVPNKILKAWGRCLQELSQIFRMAELKMIFSSSLKNICIFQMFKT